MSIRIDEVKCIGCGRCSVVCPGSLLQVEGRKAVMLYPRDCWGCVSCVKECPASAIEFFLGEDMGGNGVYMQTETEGQYLKWLFRKEGKTIRSITVDRTNANQY